MTHMTPQTLLDHYDNGQIWPAELQAPAGYSVTEAYQDGLALRALRVARGEVPRGYKIGFTNRSIWPIYQVFAPIWGTVWDSTLCEAHQPVSLAHTCQPRLEPEIAFGFQHAPTDVNDVQAVFDSLAWMAPAFEVVQSHRPSWQFTAAETIADGALHARLVVGERLALNALAADAQSLHQRLAAAQATLSKDGQALAQGAGAQVLDSPLMALQHFLKELAQCPGAPGIQAGDVVTTGTWTDAFPIQAGETWSVNFDWPACQLSVNFVD